MTDKTVEQVNKNLEKLAEFIENQPDWFKQEVNYRIENKNEKPKVKKTKKPCPACDGKGKSYGYRYCGTCKGRNWIVEKEKVEK